MPHGYVEFVDSNRVNEMACYSPKTKSQAPFPRGQRKRRRSCRIIAPLEDARTAHPHKTIVMVPCCCMLESCIDVGSVLMIVNK